MKAFIDKLDKNLLILFISNRFTISDDYHVKNLSCSFADLFLVLGSAARFNLFCFR